MKSTLATTAAILACLLLCSCQSNRSSGPIFSGYESPYPKGSAVAVAPALELPAVRKLKETLAEQYGNDSFEIIARRSAGPVSQLIIDSRGRLWRGEINEIWTVDIFGSEVDYEFHMRPDGKGGVAIQFIKHEKGA